VTFARWADKTEQQLKEYLVERVRRALEMCTAPDLCAP
jgi:hypothetical protein